VLQSKQKLQNLKDKTAWRREKFQIKSDERSCRTQLIPASGFSARRRIYPWSYTILMSQDAASVAFIWLIAVLHIVYFRVFQAVVWAKHNAARAAAVALPFLYVSRNDSPRTWSKSDLQTESQIHATAQTKAHVRPLRNLNYVDEETSLCVVQEEW